MPIPIIAEIGVNHNGKLNDALQLIDIVKETGADIAKFQLFDPDSLVSKDAKTAQYQQTNTGEQSQHALLKALVLTPKEHFECMKHCEAIGVEYLTSVFDLQSARFVVEELKCQSVKIASGEITNGPLLHYLAKSGMQIIMSTGMANLKEIQEALGVLAFGYLGMKDRPSRPAFQRAFASRDGHQKLTENVQLMHCTTEYPAPFPNLHLKFIQTLIKSFGLRVGYSDHSVGQEVAIAAVALGATQIEKHITKDRTQEGPDHKASMEPDNFKRMVQAIRNIETAMGDGTKPLSSAEENHLRLVRKSLKTVKPITIGEMFTEQNIAAKRPDGEVSPMNWWDLIGEKSDFALSEGQPLSTDKIKRLLKS